MDNISQADVAKQLALLGYENIPPRVLRRYVDQIRLHASQQPATSTHRPEPPTAAVSQHVSLTQQWSEPHHSLLMEEELEKRECRSPTETYDNTKQMFTRHESKESEDFEFEFSDFTLDCTYNNPPPSLPLSSISGESRVRFDSFLSHHTTELFEQSSLDASMDKPRPVRYDNDHLVSDEDSVFSANSNKRNNGFSYTQNGVSFYNKHASSSSAPKPVVASSQTGVRRRSKSATRGKQKRVVGATTVKRTSTANGSRPTSRCGRPMTRRQQQKQRDRGGFRTSDPVALFNQFRDTWKRDPFLNKHSRAKKSLWR